MTGIRRSAKIFVLTLTIALLLPAAVLPDPVSAVDLPPPRTGPLTPQGLRLYFDTRARAASITDGPASRALELNELLRRVYEHLTDRQQSGDAEAATRALSTALRALFELDAELAAWPGAAEDTVPLQARRGRMVAWLHGWGVLGRLVVGLSDHDLAVKKDELLGLDDRGALGLLLRIYGTIRTAEGGAFEPLQQRLAKDPELVFLLARTWPRRDGPQRAHVIPAAADLLGTPEQTARHPRDLRGGLVSLWGVVNRQLDSWSQVEEVRVRGEPSQVGATMQLAPLVSWVRSLDTVVGTPKTFDPPGTLPGSDLAERLRRLAAFMEFRQEIAAPGRLRSVVEQLGHALTAPETADLKTVLPTLLLAATAVHGSSGEEVLYDAAIWLRHLVLLAYQDQRNILTDDAKNSLARVWESWSARYKLGSAFLLSGSPPFSRDPQRFLRWNAWPPLGHSSALLADLTGAAVGYLQFHRELASREPTRFASVHELVEPAGPQSESTQSRGAYATLLADAVQALIHTAEAPLAPYALPDAAGGRLPDEPAELARLRGLDALGVGESFRRSATVREQMRLRDDLLALAADVHNTVRLYQTLVAAYRAEDPAAGVPALRSVATVSGLSPDWLYTTPTSTFAEFRRQLDTALARLKQSVAEVDTAAYLRLSFETRQRRLDAARLSLVAAELGVDIAERTVTLTRLLQEVADLSVAIEELGETIDRLRAEGEAAHAAAADVRRAYATRVRDLAAARVRALNSALEAAREIVVEAQKSLRVFADEFDGIAQRIRDEEARKRAFGIIKSVVGVVGAALAPFTGGASLAVAPFVSKGLEVYRAAGESWGAVAGVTAVIELAGAGLDSIKVTGIAANTQTLRDVQDFLRGAKQVTPHAHAFVAAVRRGPPDVAAAAAAALATGFPVRFEGKTIAIELGRSGLVIEDARLRDSLAELLKAGGVVLNDAGIRTKELVGLSGLDDRALRDRLPAAVERLVAALPQDLVNHIAGDLTVAETRRTTALHDLKRRLADPELPTPALRTFADALATGALFRHRNGRVVALERPLRQELERMAKQTHAVETALFGEKTAKLVQRLQDIQEKFVADAKTLIKEKNPAALDALAAGLRERVARLSEQELRPLQKTLDAAQRDLQGKEGEQRIALYDATAARVLAEAARLAAGQAGQRVARARRETDAARAAVQISLVESERASTLRQAALQEVSIAQLEVRRAYFEALARGVNPLAVDVKDVLSQDDEASVRRLLWGGRQSTRVQAQLVLDATVSSLIGLVQWVTLLRAVPDPSVGDGVCEGQPVPRAPVDWYGRLITLRRQSDMKVAARAAECLYAHLTALYEARATTRAAVGLAQHDGIVAPVWLHMEPPSEQTRWRRLVRLEYQDQVIAAFRYRFSAQSPTELPDDVVREEVPVDRLASAYYVDVRRIYLVAPGVRGDRLFFVVVPPRDALPHPRLWLGARLEGLLHQPSTARPEDVFLDTTDKLWIDSLKSALEFTRGTILVGALGDWTIILLSPTATTPEARAKLAAQLAEKGIGVRIPYVIVRLAHDSTR